MHVGVAVHSAYPTPFSLLHCQVRYFHSSLLRHLQREDTSGSGGVTGKYFEVHTYVR